MQIGKLFANFTCAPPDCSGRLSRFAGPSRNPRESITEEVAMRPRGLRRPLVGWFDF
jgi:hypothetical protein